jgi:hypothetical protein
MIEMWLDLYTEGDGGVDTYLMDPLANDDAQLM